MSALAKYLVRYGEMVPCRSAFIDAHTPGSNRKENFTIIGAGVSESSDKHVHIAETPGFNVGAAGQPPHCRNSLHSHRTAEAFMVLKGRWRFFWGRLGDAGEVTLEEGDFFNVPTGMFRGFENVGTAYGMVMVVTGGHDSGGPLIWTPEVLEEARAFGLVLGGNGQLYDTAKGDVMPPGVQPMPLPTDAQLRAMQEPSTREVIPRYVARYLDLVALSDRQPAKVLGADGYRHDRPGFEIEFLSNRSVDGAARACAHHEVLLPMAGHWRLDWGGETVVLNPGDTCMIPPSEVHALAAAGSDQAALYRVRATDDPAGATHAG